MILEMKIKHCPEARLKMNFYKQATEKEINYADSMLKRNDTKFRKSTEK